MAYKYPICDVFHWFCKIAKFFATEPFFQMQAKLSIPRYHFSTVNSFFQN